MKIFTQMLEFKILYIYTFYLYIYIYILFILYMCVCLVHSQFETEMQECKIK